MKKMLLLLPLLLLFAAAKAQNVKQLIGKRYEKLHEIRGFEHYIPIRGYNVFDEMVCYRYQDTTTFTELMVFQKDLEENGRTVHKVSDVLKLEGTGRHKIIVIGANRFAAFSQKNIIIAVEDIDTSGNYVAPPKSTNIYTAYTLQHKGYFFEKVPVRGLYRVGEDFYKER